MPFLSSARELLTSSGISRSLDRSFGHPCYWVSAGDSVLLVLEVEENCYWWNV